MVGETTVAEQGMAPVSAALRHAGLLDLDEEPDYQPLEGGVSSEIWLVVTRSGPICVKRALARLKVAQEWRAPVERNANEVHWLKYARDVDRSMAPRVLAHDPIAGLFAMAYLAPRAYPNWKRELAAGRIEPAVPEMVADRLVRVHERYANDAAAARVFATDDAFFALRLEPYLAAAAKAHPDLADNLVALLTRTRRTKLSLVHGDVSPKNILIGEDGPVFLDAECAWYGDPAFDLAFCLNHLMLKCLWLPAHAPALLDLFDRMAATYLDGVSWEDGREIDRRTATLLPALMLARVDGKSPVEYLADRFDKDRVRRIARRLLQEPPANLASVRIAWTAELGLWR